MTRLIAIDFDQNGNPQSMKEVGDGQAISLDLPQYQDEASAKTGGLIKGDWYQDSNGVVKIVQ